MLNYPHIQYKDMMKSQKCFMTAFTVHSGSGRLISDVMGPNMTLEQKWPWILEEFYHYRLEEVRTCLLWYLELSTQAPSQMFSHQTTHLCYSLSFPLVHMTLLVALMLQSFENRLQNVVFWNHNLHTIMVDHEAVFAWHYYLTKKYICCSTTLFGEGVWLRVLVFVRAFTIVVFVCLHSKLCSRMSYAQVHGVCSCTGMSLHWPLPAWHAHSCVLSGLLKREGTKERPFHL